MLNTMKDGVKFIVVGVLALLVLFLLIARGALVSEETAIKTLETHGFSDIRVVKKAYILIGFRGGSKGDAARFTCKAKNPAGKEVEVYVYAGWPFKGATIRTP